MKWIPEIAALCAAFIIGQQTGMTWWQGVILWIVLDLMTASGKQLDKLRGGKS
jgi:hypothetical protein